MVAGLLLRAVPLAVWAYEWGCTRDECTYLKLASRMLNGEGMTTSVGWLWAPGYPTLMAIHGYLFGWSGGIRITQILLSVAIGGLMYRLAAREGGRSAGLWAAGLYLLSPTMIFFSQSLWSECIYGGLLLLGILVFERAREHIGAEQVQKGLLWAAATGALVGCCMLFRGVATYMLPLFALAFVWRRVAVGAAWGQAGLLFVCAALTVAPYSLYASNKFGERIITDRTVGQMLWLGNNDFDPITFDWGNGTLSKHAWKRHTSEGRKHCGSISAGLERDHCEADAGKQWIKDHPEEFVARMPMRVAQLLNPHSFVTRHLRWGYWRGLPQAVDEGIILWNVSWSLAVLFGGVASLCARGRGARSVLVSLLLLYHVAAISVLAGLTRYRVPLEPLLMLYLAGALGNPRETLATLRAERWRIPVMLLMLAIGAPLVLWYLPAGWPTWRTW